MDYAGESAYRRVRHPGSTHCFPRTKTLNFNVWLRLRPADGYLVGSGLEKAWLQG
jgi:hypothetical protein